MRILFLGCRGVVGPRENELEMIVHETTRESRTNQHVLHAVLNSISSSSIDRLRRTSYASHRFRGVSELRIAGAL